MPIIDPSALVIPTPPAAPLNDAGISGSPMSSRVRTSPEMEPGAFIAVMLDARSWSAVIAGRLGVGSARALEAPIAAPATSIRTTTAMATAAPGERRMRVTPSLLSRPGASAQCPVGITQVHHSVLRPENAMGPPGRRAHG